MTQQITPNLWFTNNAEEAVDYYLSVFKDAKIIDTDTYTEAGEELSGHKKGDIITIEYELLGTRFIAINAGPMFTFNPSVSFMVECKTQKEMDYYYEKLSANPEADQCGWVQDKYGVSWQIVPETLSKFLKQGTDEQRKRVTEAFLPMKRLDMQKIQDAFDLK